MIVGYLPGVWDLFHVGHLGMLEDAKQLCDHLTVGVPSDLVVREDKGEAPIVQHKDRVRILEAITCVDSVLSYYCLSFIDHLNLVNPQKLFVSETWGKSKRHVEAEIWLAHHGRELVVIPYHGEESTTSIKSRILLRE